MTERYIGSYTFNRGQEIPLFKGTKNYRAAVQLFNTDGYPFKYLKDKDKEKLLYRALALVKKDVAKDGQELELIDDPDVTDADVTKLAFIPTESQHLEAWVQTPGVKKVIQDARTNITLHQIEKNSWGVVT
jgi:hypothetical protein